MPTTAYIALGSNLGDRHSYLNGALDSLKATPGIVITKVSTFINTAPVGGPEGQAWYLNAAAELETTLSAHDLLLQLQRVENELGRVRAERFGPRTLDLDLLLFGHECINPYEVQADLIVPHPRLLYRRFVLEPLAEIAPLAVHPLNRSTVADLLRRSKNEDKLGLWGQQALVTGSTGGIGRAIALELGSAGAGVIVHGRSPERADKVWEQVEFGYAVPSKILLADLRDQETRTHFIDQVWEAWPGGIDILVNNAGADILTGDARHWPFEKKLRELWAVDVEATMHLSRDIGARMKKKGSGVILNIGWDQAESGMEGDSGQLFGATKSAVMAFSRSLALSLAPEVRVNCIAPGWIRTAWGEGASTPWQERVLRETPLARWGTPEDIAATARWLCSPAASFITGQIIRVNGGAVR